jgi:hypothetical protein
MLLTTAVGCGLVAEEEEQAVKRPRVAVNLPPTPSLNPPEKVELLQDGSYSVAGLIGSNEGFGRGVRVFGMVLEKHSCRDASPGSLCPPSYFILVDSLEFPEIQLLVVAPEDVVGGIEEGSQEIVSGLFVQWSRSKWYVRSEGMIEIFPETDDKN